MINVNSLIVGLKKVMIKKS